MQMTIHGHHLEITTAIRDHVTNKLSKLERHFQPINSINVFLSIDNAMQKAEATLHVPGAELFANAEFDDLYVAIDALSDKLDRQLIKYKEKHRDH
jgi:putative sigma-54 modulation protein